MLHLLAGRLILLINMYIQGHRLTHFNPQNLRGLNPKEVLYSTLILSLSLLSCSNCQFVTTPLIDDTTVTKPDIVQWWCPICFTVEVHFFINFEADLCCSLSTKLLNSWRVA